MNGAHLDFQELSRRSRNGESLFYVYAHKRPTDGSIFYIGKGTRHRAMDSTNRGDHWRSVVKKHGGFDIDIAGLFESELDAFNHERFLIFSLRTFGVRLSNKTDGGDGVSGHRHTEETKRLISMKSKGRRLSDETRARMSASRIGKPVHALRVKRGPATDERKKRISMGHLSRSESCKARHADILRIALSKEIYCATNGLVFKSLVAAIDWLKCNGYPKASKSALSEHCAGKRAHAYGMQWTYNQERK